MEVIKDARVLNNIIPNVMAKLPDFYAAIGDTLLMVVWSGAISFVLGLALGVLITVTKPGGILENKVVYQILDKLVSLFRSIPFIILLTWVMPVSRAIMGTAIYVRGAIVPLVFGAVPFFTRQVESALAELDGGLIEAALSMGSTPLEIIFRVYLKESVAAIARGTTITAISLLNLTAMAGVVGAGGLGDFAIRYGHDRNMLDVTNVTVLVLVIIVCIMEFVGGKVVKKNTHYGVSDMSISNRKVVIVGAGHVGSHVGYALISQSLADEIVYIDSDHAKAVAQAFDLTDATNYLPVRTKVTAGDYSDAKDAQIMIISAGPLPTGNQTRMDTLGQTIAILKDVTKSIKESGFDGIIVNISNPADVITHYIQHTLNWAPERIFSTSTTLDSARLRRAIAQEIGIDQKSITAYALGEHGESQMVAWSAVTIAGKPLSQWREEYPDTFGKLDLDALADAGREGGWTILRGKQCTEFGIGASAAEVVRAIFYNENRVLSVSVLLDGKYGQHDVYASVPAIVGRDGIAEIIELHLTPEEQEKFNASCKTMSENYQLSLTL